MPAKPRPRLEERRADEVLRPRPAVAAFPERVREALGRDFADRVELDRTVDFFRVDPRKLDRFASPFSRRILFTVRAATSSVRRPYRPDFLALCLMCSYCRSRFGLAPRGI